MSSGLPINTDAWINLDHAADTPLSSAARAEWERVVAAGVGNPTGAHRAARAARAIVEDARDLLAATLGVRPHEIVFCSGGTEADNLAIEGIAPTAHGESVVVSAVEHAAVLRPARQRGALEVAVCATGQVDLNALADALNPETRLVSLMAVNNETGTVADLAASSGLVRSAAPAAVIHTDAVQASRWLDLAELCTLVDSASLSSHKCGGPAGVGALVVRERVELTPRQLGGSQERGLRSGSHNVAGIAAFAVALAAAQAEREAACAQGGQLRTRLTEGILTNVPGAWVATGDRHAEWSVPGIVMFGFDGIESEALVFMLDEAGVGVASGSSCASGAHEPSHVATAVGVDTASALMRCSFGPDLDLAAVDRVVAKVIDVVARLRGAA
jgi:cysteine desulfurase